MSNVLINALDSAIMECEDAERLFELNQMRITEMKKKLREEKDWDSDKRIYQTANGYLKVKIPKQICKKNEDDIIQAVYTYYYGDASKKYTLEECFYSALEKLDNKIAKGNRSAMSKTIYQSNWLRFFGDSELAKMNVSNIRKIDIHEYLEDMVADQDLSRSGLNDANILLNKAFDYANLKELVEYPVSRYVNTTDIDCREVDNSEKYYTNEERLKLLELMEKDDHVASRALSLMFCLCIRSGEIRSLKWTDVNWDDNTIFIHTSIRRSKDANNKDIFIDTDTTKNKSRKGDRKQTLSDRAMAILKKQRELSPDSTYIFEYERHSLYPNMLNKRLKKMCQLANIEYMSTHKIRFASVTTMVKANIPLTEIQKQAGHKCLQTTEHYARAGREKPLEKDMANELFN